MPEINVKRLAKKVAKNADATVGFMNQVITHRQKKGDENPYDHVRDPRGMFPKPVAEKKKATPKDIAPRVDAIRSDARKEIEEVRRERNRKIDLVRREVGLKPLK